MNNRENEAIRSETADVEAALVSFIEEVKAGQRQPSQKSETAGGNEVFFWWNENLAYLKFINRTEDSQETDYIVRVKREGKWKLHTQGNVSLEPDTEYTQGFHEWEAEDWKAQWS